MNERKNERNSNLLLKLAHKFLKNNNIKTRIINSSDINKIILAFNGGDIYLEMGYFGLINEQNKSIKGADTKIKNFIAINSGVDLFLALAPYYKNLLKPRKLQALYRWKSVKKMFNKSWLIPRISDNKFTINSKKVNQINYKEIIAATNELFKIKEVNNLFNAVKYKDKNLIVLGLGVKLTNIHLKNLVNQLKIVSSNSQISYIIKPHPNIPLNINMVRLIEKMVGYPSSNVKNVRSLELIRVLPMECILAYFKRSIYIGLLTGSVNFIKPERVHWVKTGDKKQDKLHLIYYSEFLKYWKKN